MSYLPSAIRSAASESASTGLAIRRDRYQASAPATSRPTPSATSRSSNSENQPFVRSVFFLATISAPKFCPSSWSGCPTAWNVLLSPGGVNSKVITFWPSTSVCHSSPTCSRSSSRRPEPCRKKIGAPT